MYKQLLLYHSNEDKKRPEPAAFTTGKSSVSTVAWTTLFFMLHHYCTGEDRIWVSRVSSLACQPLWLRPPRDFTLALALPQPPDVSLRLQFSLPACADSAPSLAALPGASATLTCTLSSGFSVSDCNVLLPAEARESSQVSPEILLKL